MTSYTRFSIFDRSIFSKGLTPELNNLIYGHFFGPLIEKSKMFLDEMKFNDAVTLPGIGSFLHLLTTNFGKFLPIDMIDEIGRLYFDPIEIFASAYDQYRIYADIFEEGEELTYSPAYEDLIGIKRGYPVVFDRDLLDYRPVFDLPGGGNWITSTTLALLLATCKLNIINDTYNCIVDVCYIDEPLLWAFKCACDRKNSWVLGLVSKSSVIKGEIIRFMNSAHEYYDEYQDEDPDDSLLKKYDDCYQSFLRKIHSE